MSVVHFIIEIEVAIQYGVGWLFNRDDDGGEQQFGHMKRETVCSAPVNEYFFLSTYGYVWKPKIIMM